MFAKRPDLLRRYKESPFAVMIFCRRFLVWMAFLFWQGGFLFYASVVVPVGQRVLSPATEQGFITQQVTNYLNLAGAVALPLLAWELLAAADRSLIRKSLRMICWLILAIGLAGLAWYHPQLDAHLDIETREVIEYRSFRPIHRIYLWISTVQWAAGIIYMAATLLAWQAEDRLRQNDH